MITSGFASRKIAVCLHMALLLEMRPDMITPSLRPNTCRMSTVGMLASSVQSGADGMGLASAACCAAGGVFSQNRHCLMNSFDTSKATLDTV